MRTKINNGMWIGFQGKYSHAIGLRAWAAFLVAFFLIAVPFSADANLTYFNQAWDDFDQNYSYFEYKNIDWDQVKEDYQLFFTEEMTVDNFTFWLNEMLSELHDWHVWVRTPDGEYLGYSENYDTNYPENLFTRYVKTGQYQQLGDNVIQHGIVDNNIAHIVIDTFSSGSFNNISDSDIETLFSLYSGTDGMIIDIRKNNGGSETIASKFASHFTNRELIYGYVKYRVPGNDHNAFGELISKSLTPGTTNYYDKPVVCLIGKKCMSSAEWFSLMMKNCPNVSLIGDRTRGASGNPQEFGLPNNVSYSISSWVAYTDQMMEFEDKGIAPDIQIDPAASYNNERDFVLEKAINVILEGGTNDTDKISITGCGISGSQTANSPLSFQIHAQSAAGNTLYYRFSYHPDYGTGGYDGLHWASMTGTEYVTTNSISHTFSSAGKNIVVVWAVADSNNVDSNGVPIIGWSIDNGNTACKTTITGCGISGTPSQNSPITFSVNAQNACNHPLYYRFSYHPGYGTSGYDGLHWASMTSTEYVTESSITHSFSASGKYIVVVWVVTDTNHVDAAGVPIIGFSVDID
ncbi:MAG: S41 family peptidase [Pseudomonadota bacterium]